jgi:hypothetical protein
MDDPEIEGEAKVEVVQSEILKRRRAAATAAAAKMNAHTPPAEDITVTWAATAGMPLKRIGKIWQPTGKWPVTDGVKSNVYSFKRDAYAGLEAFAESLEAHMKSGAFAIVSGAPYDVTRAITREGDNFTDEPCCRLELDFDGFKAANGRRLDRPKDFSDVLVEEVRNVLPAAFKHADCVCYATSSTGLPLNAFGKPADGAARFRLVFRLSRPLPLAMHAEIVKGLRKIPGLESLDANIYSLSHFLFVARPEFPAGMRDPIGKPVRFHQGSHRQVDVDMLLSQIDLTPESKPRDQGRYGPADADPSRRLLHVDPARRYDLIAQLVKEIPSNLHRIEWVWTGHALQGAFGDPHTGREIWNEFCGRWTIEETDAEEDDRVWDTLVFSKGKAGIGWLIQLAERAGTFPAFEAVEAIRNAQAEWAPEEAAEAFDPVDEPTKPEEDTAKMAGANTRTGNSPLPPPPSPAPPKAATAVIEPYDFWSHGDPPDMPLGLLPEAIEIYARSASIVVGADAGGFAVSALAIAAATIGDEIKLQVMPFSKWMERARLWAALVGPPGVKKTPIIGTTSEALEAEDTRLWLEYKREKMLYDMLSKAEKARTPPPVRQRRIVGDATVEALQEAFKTEPRGLLGLHDELGGWLGAMDRYGTSGQTYADRAFMLKAYNGGRCPVSRIGRGDYLLENVSLTILGGIQPDVIRKFANGVDDDGLIQRIIPVMLRPGWPPTADQKASEAVQAFNELTPLLLRLAPPDAGFLRFDDGAQRIRDELAQDHAKMSAVAEGFNKKLSTALDKQDGVFARLCVIFHCVEHADNPLGLPELVTEDIARRVEGFMIEYTRKHLFHFYGAALLEMPEEQERLASIAGFIITKELKTFANWQIQKAVRSLRKLTSKDITPVMETMEALGWLRRAGVVKTGSPPHWAVNPAVHDGRFEERSEEEEKRREEARELIAKAALAKRRWWAEEDE